MVLRRGSSLLYGLRRANPTSDPTHRSGVLLKWQSELLFATFLGLLYCTEGLQRCCGKMERRQTNQPFPRWRRPQRNGLHQPSPLAGRSAKDKIEALYDDNRTAQDSVQGQGVSMWSCLHTIQEKKRFRRTRAISIDSHGW